jgi:hypothetical protein
MHGGHVLKAAGTPIIRALSLISSLRFTLFPGDFSTSSMPGNVSPTLTKALGEIWKERAREAATPSRRRTEALAIIIAANRIRSRASSV